MNVFHILFLIHITVALINVMYPVEPIPPELLRLLEQHLEEQDWGNTYTEEITIDTPWVDQDINKEINIQIDNTYTEENTIDSSWVDQDINKDINQDINQETNTQIDSGVDSNANTAEQLEQNKQRLEREEHLRNLRTYDPINIEPSETRIKVKNLNKWMQETYPDNQRFDEKGNVVVNLMTEEMVGDFEDFCEIYGFTQKEIVNFVDQVKNSNLIEILDEEDN